MRARGIRRSCALCKKQPSLKKEWHCEPAGKTIYLLYDRCPDLRLEIDRCFNRYMEAEVGEACETLDWMLAGILPFAEGMRDQPDALLAAVAFIERCQVEAGEGHGN